MIELVRRNPREGIALVDAAARESVSYGDLLGRIDEASALLRLAVPDGGCVFLAMDQSVGAVVLYLAALAARLPVALLEPQSAALTRLVHAYGSARLLLPATFEAPPGHTRMNSCEIGYIMWSPERAVAAPTHPDLALLLSTSGSTGSPKFVRLSRRNLESNARDIAQYLEIGPRDRAIASLPLHYSYGLSVLNSHLAAGASIVLTPNSFVRPEFWADADSNGCTSFAGVPFMYETMKRLRFDPGRHPSLRTYTQAGGPLNPDLVRHFSEVMRAAGARLVVMYGQTEATARISWVPPEDLPRKAGSIGVAIPSGRLWLEPVASIAGAQELVYEGPNVMMGYAEMPSDLELGDVLRGVLRTGDLGRADEDGFFYIVGRLGRFAKLFGRRVSLEDVERDLEQRFGVAAAAFDGGDKLVIVIEAEGQGTDQIRAHAAHSLAVPLTAIDIRTQSALPRTASGKKDYRAIEGKL